MQPRPDTRRFILHTQTYDRRRQPTTIARRWGADQRIEINPKPAPGSVFMFCARAGIDRNLQSSVPYRKTGSTSSQAPAMMLHAVSLLRARRCDHTRIKPAIAWRPQSAVELAYHARCPSPRFDVPGLPARRSGSAARRKAQTVRSRCSANTSTPSTRARARVDGGYLVGT